MQKERWRQLTRLRENELRPEYGGGLKERRMAITKFCRYTGLGEHLAKIIYASSVKSTYNQRKQASKIERMVDQYIEDAKVEGTIQTDSNSGLTDIDSDASGCYVKVHYEYGEPIRHDPVFKNKMPDATIPPTHSNPPKSRLMRFWYRMKGVFRHE